MKEVTDLVSHIRRDSQLLDNDILVLRVDRRSHEGIVLEPWRPLVWLILVHYAILR